MKTAVIKFEEQQKAVEVRGKVYDIPQRTARIEGALKEWDESRNKRSDYENYYYLFEILFGTEKRDELMEKGEDENLDFLFAVYTKSIELYYEENNMAKTREMQSKLKQVTPMIDKLKETANIASAIKR